MKVVPTHLYGRKVDLVPLSSNHAADLCAAADPALFAILADRPPSNDESGFRAYVARVLATEGRSAFAVIDKQSGRAIGTSSYFDVRAAHRGLEIGFTWIGVAARGSHVNPEMKFLLLRHAFEQLGCLRVQLKTDLRNEQSQRAMAKLGCVREGVLRKHMVLPDGYVRDTVMFSITHEEWPAVKARLVARLGYEP